MLPRQQLLVVVVAAGLAGLGPLAACGDDEIRSEGRAATTTTLDGPTTTTSERPQPAPEAQCSAAGRSTVPQPQDLPAPVAEMRRAIRAAAVACDCDSLADLGERGTFAYSFGASGDPAGFWRRAEAEGGDPMRLLVELLNLPFASRSPDGGAEQYVWPRAYSYGHWSEVPPDARRELESIYGPDDLERFRRFGSYSGSRVGIAADGDWLFYIAGD